MLVPHVFFGKIKPSVVFAAVLAVVVALCDQAQAQSTTSSSNPAQIERRIQQTKPTPPPKAEPTFEVAPTAPAKPAEAFSFVLSAVNVEGVTAFAPEDLAPAYEKFMARQVDQDQIQKIAAAITKIYQDAGYVLSRAEVPPQDVVGGVLTIRVVEGFIERIEAPDVDPPVRPVTAYTKPVLAERPVKLATIERALLLINDLPGITLMDSSLSPGSAPGANVLTLKLKRKAVDGTVYLDNRGTPSSGRLQTWLSAGVNGAFGLGERFQVGLFTIPDEPKELVYAEARWSQPIGPWGTTAELAISGSVVDAGDSLAASNTESDSFRVVGKLRHPVLRSRSDSLWLNGELDYYNLGEDRFNATNFEDRNRAARLGLEYYRAEAFGGDFYAKARYSRGLDLFGASDAGRAELSRSDGKSSFDKVDVELRRVQLLGAGFSLLAQAKGQWSNQPVLSAEEFALGGSRYGRAFDYSELVGDDGIGGLIELRYGGKNPLPWIENYEFYGFYDGGAVWNDGAEREALTSAGIGARVTWKKQLYTEVQVAKPLNRVVATEGDDDLRVLFAVNLSL